jgi:hypothetical protein
VPELAPDLTCTVVSIKQVNGPREYLLWGFGGHPVVLGGASKVVSADYPGAANALIKEWVPGARPIFFLGGAGNAHPWVATQEDAAQIEPVARAAAAFVTLLREGSHSARNSELRLRTAARRVTIGDHELDLAVWRLGELWIVTVPVELFGELSNQIREALDGPVLISTVTNGWHSYWPDEASFPEGGYEVNNAQNAGLESGAGEELVEAVIALARTLDGDERGTNVDDAAE